MDARTRPTAPALYDVDTLQTISDWLFKLQELSTTTALDLFPKLVMDSLKQLVPHQASFWGGGRPPANAPILHYIYLHDINPAHLAVWEAHKEDTADITCLMVENAGQALSFSASRTPNHPAFTQVFGPQGIHDFMSIYLLEPQIGLYHALSLYRTDGIPFTESERGVFQAVARHLVSAMRTCQITQIKRLNESPLIGLAAKAIVDTEGVIHFAEDRLLAALRSEWPDWQGPWLPTDAWNKLAHSEAPQQFIGERTVLSLEGNETLRLLSARPKLAIDELSKREREVAKLFASGLSNKEIALHLDVSPSTIRNQINTAYEKLGLSDKGALSAYLSQF